MLLLSDSNEANVIEAFNTFNSISRYMYLDGIHKGHTLYNY